MSRRTLTAEAELEHLENAMANLGISQALLELITERLQTAKGGGIAELRANVAETTAAIWKAQAGLRELWNVQAAMS